MVTLSETNAKFAIHFYHLLTCEHPWENVLFSPVNFATALGLLVLGSDCETAAKIEKLIHWDEFIKSSGPRTRRILAESRNYGCLGDRQRVNLAYRTSPTMVPDYECEAPEGVHTAFHKILAELYKPSAGHVLSVANRLCGDWDIAFLQKFLYCALKLYWTKVDRVKIHNAPEEVRQLINLWADVQTQGKIKDLLPKGSINCLTQLLQLNALYFKGQWEVKFNKEFTQEGPFFLNEKDCTAVQLMYRKGQYRTGKIEGCDVQVLEIPYRNHNLSLFILLPRNCKPESLRELEDELDELLLDWSCILKLKEVEVLIPKFSIEKCLEPSAYLDMSALTDPQKANFSRATTTAGVALSQLVHHTVIEIDEEGGEQPEAPTCHHDMHPCQEPEPFVANHPFVYYVLHKATQSLVALGKFIKPEERVDVH